MSADPPAFAIIIPHRDDVTRLTRCLAAVVPQLGPGDEIVVADNGSTQSLDPVRAAHPGLRIVEELASGAGLARNRGVSATTVDWLLFLDADCVPAPDWLASARRIARAGAVIGGRVEIFHETPPPLTGAQAFEAVFAFRMRSYLDRKGFLGAGNLLTSRAVFEDVGGFRAGLAEDVDWSRRAAAAGHALIYDDRLTVRHPSRSDWAALARKWRRLVDEGFAGTTARSRPTWVIKALAMPLSIPAHAPRILLSDALRRRDKLRALIVLSRLRLLRMRWMLGQAVTGRP